MRRSARCRASVPWDRPARGLGGRAYQFRPTELYFPGPGPPPAFVPRPARPLCSLSLHALFGKHKTPGPAAGPFQASQAALENAARLGYLGTPPGAGPGGLRGGRAPAARARPLRLPGWGWGRAARASPARHPRCPGHQDFLQAPAFPLKIRGTSGAPSPRLCVLNGPEVHLTQNLEA